MLPKPSPFSLSLALFLLAFPAFLFSPIAGESLIVFALASLLAGVALDLQGLKKWNLGRIKWSKSGLVLCSVLCMWLFSGGVAFGTMQTNVTVGGAGTVKAVNVEVYQDAACTRVLSNIPWGMVEAPSSNQFVGFVKATGSAPITLSMATSGWTPSNCLSYMSLAWNMSRVNMSPGQVKPMAFNLAIYSNATSSGITNFQFQITVTGTG